MWRALVFIGLLAVAASAAVWLADRPGDVLVTWGGYQAQTTVAVALIGTVAIALALSLLWTAVRFLLNLPRRMGESSRARRRARGYQAVSRGMVAVGAGDPLAARRHAGEAERLLGREPLTLLLKAQAAQVSGDRAAAEAAFRRLVDDAETRVLGLRGLFVEARRRGDLAAARGYALEAARLAPSATWSNDAVLEAQSAEGDWRGAIATIERRSSLGLVDASTARRHRAVLLAADALARADEDPDGALASALQAVKLAPDLVPAAALAGRLLSRRGDLRRAAKIVEAAWKALPHPDLAAVYLDLRPGDSAQDRLHRAETLAKLSSWAPEARLALARAALDARDFGRARRTLEPLLAERPTTRTCLLMADLEQAEHGATGKVREWLARAARAPRDPAWIADGVVSDHWAPTSPVTGRLDAFVWQAPPDVLAGPDSSTIADFGEGPDPDVSAFALGAPAEPVSAPAPMVIHDDAASVLHTAEPKPPVVPGLSAPTDTAVPAVPNPDAADRVGEGPPQQAEPAKANGAGAPAADQPAPVSFPVDHAPGNPAAQAEQAKPQRSGLFG